MGVGSQPSADELAGIVQVGRDAFAAFHDGFAAGLDSKTVRQFKTYALLAGQGAPDREVYAVVFGEMERRRWPGYMPAAIKAGIFDGPERRRASLTLQRYLRIEDGLPDAELLVPGTLSAQARLCRVELHAPQGSETGTGFLVGPQAVLTNWHVAEKLFDKASGQPIEPAPFDVHVWFDLFRSTAGAAQPGVRFVLAPKWHIASGRAFPLGAESLLWNGAADAAAVQSLRDNPDFVALRLNAAPGFDRGWYDLAAFGKPVATRSCHLFHHPGSFAQRYNPGTVTHLVGDDAIRCRHSANSIMGSSGGLLLDVNWRPIALHQGGIDDNGCIDPETNKPVAEDNVAIPLKAIAARLGDVATADEKYRVLTRLERTRRPVFGRDQLFQYVLEAYRGERPILVVRSRPDSLSRDVPPPMGRSFTLDVLKERLPADRNAYVELSAVEVGSDARALATEILNRFDRGILQVMELPRPEDAGTTLVGYIKDHLCRDFGNAIEQHARGRRVWLCIDDLERFDLSPTGSAREFLDTLYAQIRSYPSLRIVLLGLRGELPSIANANANVEVLDKAPDEADLATWVRRRLGPGHPMGAEVAALVGRVIKGGGEAAGGGIRTLAEFVRLKVDPFIPEPVR